MRKLVIEIEANQPEADWLWDSIRDRKEINGVMVRSIADGTLYELLSTINFDAEEESNVP